MAQVNGVDNTVLAYIYRHIPDYEYKESDFVMGHNLLDSEEEWNLEIPRPTKEELESITCEECDLVCNERHKKESLKKFVEKDNNMKNFREQINKTLQKMEEKIKLLEDKVNELSRKDQETIDVNNKKTIKRTITDIINRLEKLERGSCAS